MDLVGDYAGSELFVVEGDSLLLRCLSDPKLDFNGKSLIFSEYWHKAARAWTTREQLVEVNLISISSHTTEMFI